MDLNDYVRAVVARWMWVVVAAMVGLLFAGGLSAAATPTYQATALLYVQAGQIDGPEDPAYAALVDSEILPSVARLGTSTAVLVEVAERLDPSVPVGRLAGAVQVETEDDATGIRVTAVDESPARAAAVANAVGEVVSRRAEQLFSGSENMLSVSLVQPAAVPRFSDGPAPGLMAALGMLAGGGLAVLAAGLAELGRPRLRGRRDVGGVTDAPVLAVLSRLSPGSPDRSEELARLRWTLRSAAAGGAPGRIAVCGPAPATNALVAQLALPGQTSFVPVPDPRAVRDTGPVDGVLLVVDGRGTTRRQLAGLVAEVRAAGAALIGVVVEGVLPRRAGWRSQLRAGFRGDASQWLEDRAQARLAESPAGSVPRATQVTAALAMAALGFTRPLPMAVTTGLIAAVALLPVWAPTVRRYRGATLLCVLTGLGLVCGYLLAWTSSGEHGFARYGAASTTILLLTVAGGTGLVLWARTVISVPVLGVAYGLGALATGLLAAPESENAFKFALSYPLTVIALALLVGRARPWLTIGVLGVLGILNALNDARSAFAFAVLAAALVLWQAGPAHRARSHWSVLVLLASAAVGGYWALRELLLAGALGAGLQERTAIQIEQSGSLLLGGRPEWAATWALMQQNPLGFGLGTLPTAEDVNVAATGLAPTHIPTIQGYLENYLLHDGFELHSIIADLWASLGPVGVLLGLTMGALLVWGLASGVGRRQAPGLLCWLVPLGVWGLLFGPLPTGLPKLALALGLALLPLGSVAGPRERAERDVDPGRPAGRRPLEVPDAVAST